jgi:hypothetical protein
MHAVKIISFCLSPALLCSILLASVSAADWSTIRGGNTRSGFTPVEIKPPFRLAWERHFDGERIGTVLEPIAVRQALGKSQSGLEQVGKVFVATHQGNLYALNSGTGQPIWRFQARGPFLHSPACVDDQVVAASTDGTIYTLDAESGRILSMHFAGTGGFSASPAVANGIAFIGTRAGDFMALDLRQKKVLWRQTLGAPIRQTAAVDGNRVFVTAEDLKVRSLDFASGEIIWTSAPLAGQTARDSYPIITHSDGRTFIIIRTNPLLNMAQRIARDRSLLSRNAGIDDSDWRKVDAWIKSSQARGTPELWAREQQAIIKHLDENPDARSFHVLDAASGKEAFTPPVLWAGGCQGIGVQPALAADGRWVVLYRSAYGNWNLGVAPLVALGLLDIGQNKVTPLFHQHGTQPPWNTFWGTADEAQSLQVAGKTVLIVHQGTLSGFDLDSLRLFPIWGKRDTYGGFNNPPWARNEWHGPSRSSVAILDYRIYWQTGSRILCIVTGESGEPAEPTLIKPEQVASSTAPRPPQRTRPELRAQLKSAVEELLAQRWAPLLVEPGLAGRDFSFEHSGEYFEALAWAYPHLPDELKPQLKAQLAQEWQQHQPFSPQTWYPPGQGARREWFSVTGELLARRGNDPQFHPFGNVHAARLYALRCGEKKLLAEHWPAIEGAYKDFIDSGWQLDGQKGDLFANRYLASLLAFAQISHETGHADLAKDAQQRADSTAEALLAWWNRAAGRGTLTTFEGPSQLDPFLGQGDAISLRITPHRHKLALFHDLSPDVAALIRAKAPDAFDKVWRAFSALHQTWQLTGEERQVHFGENFIDPPDLAVSAYKALAWLGGASAEQLEAAIDLPFCRADLYHIIKLSLTLEASP